MIRAGGERYIVALVRILRVMRVVGDSGQVLADDEAKATRGAEELAACACATRDAQSQSSMQV